MKLIARKYGGSLIVTIPKKDFPDAKVGDSFWIYEEEQLSLEERLKRLDSLIHYESDKTIDMLKHQHKK